MITTALAIAATLASFITWWIRRRAEQQDTPTAHYEQTRNEIDASIADGPAGLDTINQLVDRGVALRLRPGATGGSGDPSRPGDSIPSGQPMSDQPPQPVSGAAGPHAGNSASIGSQP